MPDTRAQTLIKHGCVTLMNAWLARRWSLLVGQTVDLQQRGQAPWLDRATAEFSLTVDGQHHGLMNLSEVEWAEECSPLGAEVVMRRESAALTLELRNFMFHARPGLWRRSRIFNRGGKTVTLQQAICEVFLLPEGAKAETGGLEPPLLGVNWLEAGRALALARELDGFLLLAGSGGTCSVFDQGARAGVRSAAAVPLPPGAWVDLPEAYLLPYAGSRKQAWDTEVEPFLRHVQSCVEYEKDRAEAAREPLDEAMPDSAPPGPAGN